MVQQPYTLPIQAANCRPPGGGASTCETKRSNFGLLVLSSVMFALLSTLTRCSWLSGVRSSLSNSPTSHHDSFHSFAGTKGPRHPYILPLRGFPLIFPIYIPPWIPAACATWYPRHSPRLKVLPHVIVSITFATVLGRGKSQTALNFHILSCPTVVGVTPTFRFIRDYASLRSPLPGTYNYLVP
jgi:hypothetical protein